MVDNDPEEGSGSEQGVDRPKDPIVDSSADIICQQVMKDEVLLSEKHVRHFMVLESAEKKQAEKGWIRAFSDSIAGQQGEKSCIVSILGGFLHSISEAGVLRLFRQNGGIKHALGREILEE